MGIQRKSSSKDSVVLQCAEIALIKQMAPLVVYVAVKSSSKCSVHCNASEEQGGNLKKKKKERNACEVIHGFHPSVAYFKHPKPHWICERIYPEFIFFIGGRNISAQIAPDVRYSILGRIPCQWESSWYRGWNVFAIRYRMAPPAARWSRAAFQSLSSDWRPYAKLRNARKSALGCAQKLGWTSNSEAGKSCSALKRKKNPRSGWTWRGKRLSR